MRNTLLLAALALTSSCLPKERWEVFTKTDEGTACVEGQADATATVFVDADICLSSSCSRNATGSCSATVDGSVISVSAEFQWEEATGNVDCTDDCGILTAECEVGPLTAGTYTVQLGDADLSVTIPTVEECSWF